MLGSLRAAVGTKQNSVQREDLKRDPGSQPPTIRPPGLRPPLSALSRPRPPCLGLGHPSQASATDPLLFAGSLDISLPTTTVSEVSFPLSWSCTSSYG